MECSTSTRRGVIIGATVTIVISAVALIIIAVLYALATNVGLMVSRKTVQQATTDPEELRTFAPWLLE
ncbi:hypothetical protein CLF_106478, partial [Clonorchis sinensis]